MTKPIVIVRGGGDRSLTEQITEVLGRDVVLIVDDCASLERELFAGAYDAERLDEPLRLPDPITMEIVMRKETKMMAEPIYFDRPAKDWQQNEKRGRMKPRRR